MEEFYGIDLGTTNSCIAIIDEEDSVTVVTNEEGQLTTPSVVAYDEDGSPYVGTAAKSNMANDPERTVSFIKREMSNDNYKRRIGNIDINPIDVSAEILKKLVRDANQKRQDEEGKDPIHKVVITVPAYFGNAERTRTMEAGKRAGLEVISLINEPTAAALSFGIKNRQNRTILVYDLGGGTFDVTLLEMFEGVLEVKASSGDNKLGGKDFDQQLIQYLTKRFQEQHGMDITDDLSAMVRVRDEALRCKIALSTQEEYHVQLPVLATKNNIPLAMDEIITRSIFEGLIQDLVERTHRPIDTVLSDSGLSKEQIDKILLVGGSTRVPLVRKDLEEYLGKAPVAAVDPDYAVAQGAAIQAAIISGQIDESSEL